MEGSHCKREGRCTLVTLRLIIADKSVFHPVDVVPVIFNNNNKHSIVIISPPPRTLTRDL